MAPAGSMNRTPTQKEVIKNLLSQRLPLYRKADICVDTDNKTPRETAQEIMKKLKL
jgi:shikimate kinase